MKQTVQWLLFDLGGVLYEINSDRCNAAFNTFAPAVSLHSLYETHPAVFHQFDTGKLDPAGFRSFLRAAMQITASDAAIDAAWNQLLVDLFPRRLALLTDLRKQWRLAMLSNTNPIHAQAIFGKYPQLRALFDEIILSYQVGFRKPDAAIFRLATHLLNAPPQHILFIDDLQANIEAAAAAGFQTLWVTDPAQLETAMYLQLVDGK